MMIQVKLSGVILGYWVDHDHSGADRDSIVEYLAVHTIQILE